MRSFKQTDSVMEKADVLLGCQWGDEGKAKMVDCLAKNYDIIVRFGGGANAGHTVYRDGKKFVFHLLPSGVMSPEPVCVLGNGMVIDLVELTREMQMVQAAGISLKNRFFISSRAFVVFPFHKSLDQWREKKRNNKIGSTKRGIGPAYGDKTLRLGIRVSDLANESCLREKLELTLADKDEYLNANKTGNTDENAVNLATKKNQNGFTISDDWDLKKLIDDTRAVYHEIKEYVTDTVSYLNRSMKSGKKVLLEGAQGVGLDLDFGTYPYVTSSSTTVAGACQGSGIAPTRIGQVFGIVKAYVTRVGEGFLPTQLDGKEMERLQKAGHEIGATTGRSRRCGWLDILQVRQALEVNGVSDLTITKLDVFDKYEKNICLHALYARWKRIALLSGFL